jgi:hypothetical protein
VNILVSKDLTTYSTMQTLNNNEPVSIPVANLDPAFLPKDDASLAKLIAKQYEDAGLDPRAAFDSPEDAINDFGGPTAFL